MTHFKEPTHIKCIIRNTYQCSHLAHIAIRIWWIWWYAFIITICTHVLLITWGIHIRDFFIIIIVFMKVVNNIFFSRGWHGQGHIRWKWWQSGSCWQANAILHMPSIIQRWWMIFQWKMHLYVGDVIGPFDVVFQTIHVRNDSCEAFLFLLLPSWSSSFWNGIAFGVWIYIFYNKLC